MGTVVRFVGHARASAGHRSGLSSDRGTPVTRSIGNTNSAGTPFLECDSQYEICCCVVPIRSASRFWLPAVSHARFNASDMRTQYPVLGGKQPKSLFGTGNLNLSKIPAMRGIDKLAFGSRIKRRRAAIGLNQAALADALGIPQQTVDNWEHGKVAHPRCINELAEVLNTTRAWLLWEEGPEQVSVANPFDQINSLLQRVKPQQAGAVIRFLKTLADTEAA